MKHLVIGEGEVGLALARLLDCDSIDKDMVAQEGHYDMIHICFPYQIDDFVGTVQDYEAQYLPEHVVVHSTVKIGTCDPRGWTHSPVRVR